MDELRIHKIKFLIAQAIAPVLLLVCVQIYSDFALPWIPVLCIAFVAAIGFAFFSIFFSQYVLVALIDDSLIWNRSKALGKGKVKLKEARRVFSPNPLFIVLKDKDNSVVRIPKPFWAENPKKIQRILESIE